MRWQIEKLINEEINGIKLEPYRNHPRVLEVRIAMFYKMIATEYNDSIAIGLMRNLCTTFRCNWDILKNIVENVFEIRRKEKTDTMRWRQEVVFMGVLTNQSRYRIARRMLGLTVETTYRKETNLTPKNFITQEWIDSLDESVVMCNIPAYKFEVERFLFEWDNLMEVLGRVQVSKDKKDHRKP